MITEVLHIAKTVRHAALAEQWSQDEYDEFMEDCGYSDMWTTDSWHRAVMELSNYPSDEENDLEPIERTFGEVSVIDVMNDTDEHPSGAVAIDTGAGRYILEHGHEFGYGVLELWRVIED